MPHNNKTGKHKHYHLSLSLSTLLDKIRARWDHSKLKNITILPKMTLQIYSRPEYLSEN